MHHSHATTVKSFFPYAVKWLRSAEGIFLGYAMYRIIYIWFLILYLLRWSHYHTIPPRGHCSLRRFPRNRDISEFRPIRVTVYCSNETVFRELASDALSDSLLQRASAPQKVRGSDTHTNHAAPLNFIPRLILVASSIARVTCRK